MRASSVIDCDPRQDSIGSAFVKLYSDEFQASLKSVQNPYGDGMVSQKIIEVLKKVELSNILKKSFYDFGEAL